MTGDCSSVPIGTSSAAVFICDGGIGETVADCVTIGDCWLFGLIKLDTKLPKPFQSLPKKLPCRVF